MKKIFLQTDLGVEAGSSGPYTRPAEDRQALDSQTSGRDY